VISGYSEIAGDFMYVAINYLAGTDMITSVRDGGVDSFAYVGGEFANSESVAFYDVASEHGGSVTITVTISATEFGDCRVGQLTAGTAVGVVGKGNSTASGTILNMANVATNEPSLLLTIVSATRLTGAFLMDAPVGNWVMAQAATGYVPGTGSGLYGYNDTSSGTVTFTLTTGNAVSISGIAVEFYIPTSGGAVSTVSGWFTVPQNQGGEFGEFAVWVGIGGVQTSGRSNFAPLWQAGIAYNGSATVPYAFWEACPAGNGVCSGALGYGYNYGFHPGWGDTLSVTVTSAGGVSTCSMRDWSLHNKPYWNATYTNSSFIPYDQSGWWVLEPKGSSLALTNIPVWNITVNGAFPTLYASFMNLDDSTFNWEGTYLSAGNPTFTIYNV